VVLPTELYVEARGKSDLSVLLMGWFYGGLLHEVG
jgi:hypothetical protein